MSSPAQRAFMFVLQGTTHIVGFSLLCALVLFIGSRGYPLSQSILGIMTFFPAFQETMEEMNRKPDGQERKTKLLRALGAMLIVFFWVAAFIVEATQAPQQDVRKTLVWSAVAAVGLYIVINVLVFVSRITLAY